MSVPERLNKVAEIIAERGAQHGDLDAQFSVTALWWRSYLTARTGQPVKLDAQDVAALMALLKLSRHAHQPGHEDHMDDLIGYSAIAAELAQ